MAKDLEGQLNALLKKADVEPQCDKCSKRSAQPVVTSVSCEACGNLYARCEAHGGEAGCKRSLKSHKPLCFGPRLPDKWKPRFPLPGQP